MTELELLDRLQQVSCRLDFHETLTFGSFIAIMIYSISHFIRTFTETKHTEKLKNYLNKIQVHD